MAKKWVRKTSSRCTFVFFVQWINKIETESLSYFCMYMKKRYQAWSLFYLTSTCHGLAHSFYALQGEWCLSSDMQEHCMQGKWLQLRGIREGLELEGNLIISSNSPASLFLVQESSFKSKYRNNNLLLMTILVPERELLLIKSKDGSTAPKALLHLQEYLWVHDSV